MNKLSVLFFTMLVTGLSNCGQKGENGKFDAVIHTRDSLKKRNTKLLTVYDTLTRAHEQLAQRLDKLDSLDSAWLDKMENHELTIEKHLESFEKHETIFSEDHELVKEKDNAASGAQVIAMEKRYKEIDHELDKIAREQDVMGAEHSSIEEALPQE